MTEIKSELPGWKGAVTRALVIGVSNYPFVTGPAATDRGRDSGFANLGCAARTAAEVALWLLDEHHDPEAPLASLQILLSPGEAEVPAHVSARLGNPSPATREAAEGALRKLFDESAGRRDDRIVVYVAGHGVQVTRTDVTLLLEDFGAGPRSRKLFAAGIDMAEAHAAFVDDDLPRRQTWFVDACRRPTDATAEYAEVQAPPIFDLRRRGVVDSSPLILSASRGAGAFGAAGGLTFFGEALLDGLRGAAAAPPGADEDGWAVTVGSLGSYLVKQVRARAAARAQEQLVDVTGTANPAVIHRFMTPPEVALRVELSPDEAHPSSIGSLMADGTTCVCGPSTEWPAEWSVAAGLYTLNVDTEPPYQPVVHRPLLLAPPSQVATVTVGAG